MFGPELKCKQYSYVTWYRVRKGTNDQYELNLLLASTFGQASGQTAICWWCRNAAPFPIQSMPCMVQNCYLALWKGQTRNSLWLNSFLSLASLVGSVVLGVLVCRASGQFDVTHFIWWCIACSINNGFEGRKHQKCPQCHVQTHTLSSEPPTVPTLVYRTEVYLWCSGVSSGYQFS